MTGGCEPALPSAPAEFPYSGRAFPAVRLSLPPLELRGLRRLHDGGFLRRRPSFTWRKLPGEDSLALAVAKELCRERTALFRNELFDERRLPFGEKPAGDIRNDDDLAQFPGQAGLRLALVLFLAQMRFADVTGRRVVYVFRASRRRRRSGHGQRMFSG